MRLTDRTEHAIMRAMLRRCRRLLAIGIGMADRHGPQGIEATGEGAEWHHRQRDDLEPRREPCDSETGGEFHRLDIQADPGSVTFRAVAGKFLPSTASR